MDILKILNNIIKSEANKWLKDIQVNISKGVLYAWVEQVNTILDQLEPTQIEIIKKKFKGIKKTRQLIDKLAELLVAVEYWSDNPVFLSDDSSGPDLHLKRTNQFIEVKHLNTSDIHNKIVDKIGDQGGVAIIGSRTGTMESFKAEDEKRHEKLIVKVKDAINKAHSQLDGYEGFIYLIYKVDLLPLYLGNQNTRAAALEQIIKKYCQEKNISIVVRESSTILK